MQDTTLATFIWISGPLMVGTVIGAWTSTARLFVARWGGVRLPVWAPWLVTVLAVLVGMVLAATQLITSATGAEVSPGAARTAAGVVALLLSPAWLGGASLAVLGMVLHYSVDALLGGVGLAPVVHEGLSLGLRAVWALISLMMLYTALRTTYLFTAAHFSASIEAVVGQVGLGQLLLNLAAVVLAVFGMVAPWLLERPRI